MQPIRDVALHYGVLDEEIENYGDHKAKIKLSLLDRLKEKKDGALVLVTAINPTPAGEGKTTVSVGLGDALNRLGKQTVIALREPSLGPVFGMKGGAAGGGYAQVVPMEDINLHFTGDLHAIAAANNLLAAILDNHIYQGNALNIDVRKIPWKRCVDINDRQLRFVVNGLGGGVNGIPREDGYDITVASEVMAILCLSKDVSDLKRRLRRTVVAYTRDDQPIRIADLKADGAMAALLKDAIKPNLVQTLEGNAAIIHGGPFANIAHGCNSVLATRMALKLGEYCVTEAGFGADLGAEKFLDIKCRKSGLRPSAVVVVATARALKSHGGVEKEHLTKENLCALEQGFANLRVHIENLTKVYHLPVVVAVNHFESDTQAELELIQRECAKLGVEAIATQVWAKGGEGALELAQKVVELCQKPSHMHFCYDQDMSIADKIRAVVERVYRGGNVVFLPHARKEMDKLETLGFGKFPVCIAKTQYSFSDKPTMKGAPQGFEVTVRDMKISAGAGFTVAYLGEIMTMPGLPAKPAAEKITVDADGRIDGLF